MGHTFGLIAQELRLSEYPDPLVPHRSAVFCSNQHKDSLIPLWKEEMLMNKFLSIHGYTKHQFKM